MPAHKTPRSVQFVVLRAISEGFTYPQAAAISGVSATSVGRFVRENGGVTRRETNRRAQDLTAEEREQIRVGVEAGDSDAEIGRSIGRHRCTIGREIGRNGGRKKYRAFQADRRADKAAQRPRARWTQLRPLLWAKVQIMLADWYSPQQIAGKLRKDHPGESQWWVSHESIYHAIFVQTKPELRRELAACLRSGRAIRRPQGRYSSKGTGSKIKDMVNISERPAAVEDRAARLPALGATGHPDW